ncbi:unnamed protein product [Trichobilharzia regenti]|nr:unnamed protein product [Trichobilharzia regenti]
MSSVRSICLHTPDYIAQILVTGYPTPTLKCNDLPLGEPTMISDEPQGGTWLYPVVLDKITPQHLREYMCTANNSLGSVNHKLEITGKCIIQ